MRSPRYSRTRSPGLKALKMKYKCHNLLIFHVITWIDFDIFELLMIKRVIKKLYSIVKSWYFSRYTFSLIPLYDLWSKQKEILKTDNYELYTNSKTEMIFDMITYQKLELRLKSSQKFQIEMIFDTTTYLNDYLYKWLPI